MDKRTYADRRDYMLPYLKEYRKRRRLTDPEFAQRLKEQNKKHRLPEAHAAREAVRRAIRSGRLTKPDVCEQCGEGGPIEAAHSDYARRFDVRWLCVPCHRKWDKEEPKQCKP